MSAAQVNVDRIPRVCFATVDGIRRIMPSLERSHPDRKNAGRKLAFRQPLVWPAAQQHADGGQEKQKRRAEGSGRDRFFVVFIHDLNFI